MNWSANQRAEGNAIAINTVVGYWRLSGKPVSQGWIMSVSGDAENGAVNGVEFPRFTEWKGGEEVERLVAQVKQGDIAGLREYLKRSREERDWQDRCFVLDFVVPELRKEVFDFWSDTEPGKADLQLIRCAWFSNRSWEMRGAGTADKVREGGFESAADCVTQAMEALEQVVRLDPEDPTAHALIMRALIIFDQLVPHMQASFARVEQLAPSLVPAHRYFVNAHGERWYGNHEKSLEFARNASRSAPAGSDMAFCVFMAHDRVRTYLRDFDKNDKAAREYLFNNKQVRDELAAEFDHWTAPPYSARRSSVPYLHLAARWFYFLRDPDRLKRALELIDGRFIPDEWGSSDKALDIFENACDLAAGISPEDRYKADPLMECMKKISLAEKSRKRGEWADAGEASIAAISVANFASPELAPCLIAAGLLNLHLFMKKMGAADKAGDAHAKAMAQLENCNALEVPANVAQSVAAALTEIREYNRAIPFWGQALKVSDEVDPLELATMLLGLGQSYFHVGLNSYAVAPLRAALKMFRAYPSDPRLTNVLLLLGNALRRSSPDEAEAIFKEVAEMHTTKLQYVSATAAWTNLGVLCAEQGRNDEAMEYYQRVLRVREQTKGTPPARMASILSNISNCHRRAGQFSEAHKTADRALDLIPKDDPSRPNMLHSKGTIYRDEGKLDKAEDWFSKARDLCSRQPNPNLRELAEFIEDDINALNAIGKAAKADKAREELATIRAKLDLTPSTDAELIRANPLTDAAVMVELAFGTRPKRSNLTKDINELADRLSKRVEVEESGRYSNWLGLPENITLIFYGPEGEKLANTIASSAGGEMLCEGARIIVQQGGKQREIGVAIASSKMN
jgi:tetratricopeptide (TPR) repeat protein